MSFGRILVYNPFSHLEITFNWYSVRGESVFPSITESEQGRSSFSPWLHSRTQAATRPSLCQLDLHIWGFEFFNEKRDRIYSCYLWEWSGAVKGFPCQSTLFWPQMKYEYKFTHKLLDAHLLHDMWYFYPRNFLGLSIPWSDRGFWTSLNWLEKALVVAFVASLWRITLGSELQWLNVNEIWDFLFLFTFLVQMKWICIVLGRQTGLLPVQLRTISSYLLNTIS